MTTNTTKEKILIEAETLFAEKGYDGTSVRDIAKAAEVNLAAINYHFKNKENLYLSLFIASCEKMEANIDELYVEGISTEDFAWKLYNSFMENSTSLMNSFKMMLTTSVSFPEGYYKDDDNFGPPGQDTLLKVISRDVGDEVPVTAKLWAVHAIFTHLVHSALMMSTSFMKERVERIPVLSPESKKNGISILVSAILTEIKNNPNNWDEVFSCGAIK